MQTNKLFIFVCSCADGKWRRVHIWLWAAWAAWTWRCQLQVRVGEKSIDLSV